MEYIFNDNKNNEKLYSIRFTNEEMKRKNNYAYDNETKIIKRVREKKKCKKFIFPLLKFVLNNQKKKKLK
jgi:hypothetical protein